MNVAQNAAKVDLLLNSVLRSAGLRLAYDLETDDSTASLSVIFTGADVPHLLARNAELLLALEHVATQVIRLDPSEHELVSFDAGGFKEERDRGIAQLARQGLAAIRESGLAYHFRPMNSRERRLLHLALASSGLPTQSEGEGSMRHLVLHAKPVTGR